MSDEGDVIRRVTESDGPVYPEHEKLQTIAPLSQACHDFIEWCSTKGYHLMKWTEFEDGEGYTPAPSIRDLLAEHFEIDQDQIEIEKRAMIGYMRAANEPKDEKPDV
jgi:hypothetical protein